MQLEEKWNEPFAVYNIINRRKFDDQLGKNKDKNNLKEWIEILLLDRNVLIYFDVDEIRCTLKNISNVPELDPVCLKRDPDITNWFTAWEIEKEKFVTFHFSDVKQIVVRSEGINELSSAENQLKFRANKSKMGDGKSS